MCYGMNCLFEDSSGSCTANNVLVDSFIQSKNLDVIKCFIGGGELVTRKATDEEWNQSVNLWKEIKDYSKHYYGGKING